MVCEVCSKPCTSNTDLQDHFNEHDVGTTTCNLCNKKVLDLEFSQKHHLREEHDGVSQCRLCSKIFYSANLISRHFRYMHPQRKNFKCEKCGDIFLSKDEHRKHYEWCEKRPKVPETTPLSSHGLPLDGINCTTCHKKFPNLQSLQNHLLSLDCNSFEIELETPKVHSQNVDLKPQPELLKEKMEKDVDVKRKKNPGEPVNCDRCKMTFRNKLRLAKHVWHVHTNEFMSEEAKEKKKVAEMRKLERRNSAAKQGSESTILPVDQCELNKRGEKTKITVSDDKSTPKKQKAKNFSCLECGKKYWKGSLLEAHIARRHMQESTGPTTFRKILPKPKTENVAEMLPVQPVQNEKYNTQLPTTVEEILIERDEISDGSYPMTSKPSAVTSQPEATSVPNQISITIGPVGQMQNVCIPVVINSFVPGASTPVTNNNASLCFQNGHIGNIPSSVYSPPASGTGPTAAVMFNFNKSQTFGTNLRRIAPAYGPNQKVGYEDNLSTDVNTTTMPIKPSHNLTSSQIQVGRSSNENTAKSNVLLQRTQTDHNSVNKPQEQNNCSKIVQSPGDSPSKLANIVYNTFMESKKNNNTAVISKNQHPEKQRDDTSDLIRLDKPAVDQGAQSEQQGYNTYLKSKKNKLAFVSKSQGVSGHPEMEYEKNISESATHTQTVEKDAVSQNKRKENTSSDCRVEKRRRICDKEKPENQKEESVIIAVSDDEDFELEIIHAEPGRRTSQESEQGARKPGLFVDCFICDKRFNRINKLLHHLKNNHN